MNVSALEEKEPADTPYIKSVRMLLQSFTDPGQNHVLWPEFIDLLSYLEEK